jgi:hypothetical protein
MVRLPLLIVRWKIKLRSDAERSGQYFLSIWHWSANWKWLELGIIGLFAGALAVHEYSLAIAFALGAVFSAFSKLWHWKIHASLKIFGSLFTIL